MRNLHEQGGDMKIVERNRILIKIQRNNYAWLYLSNLKEELRKTHLSGTRTLTLE